MTRYFTQKITIGELAKEIMRVHKTSEDYEHYNLDDEIHIARAVEDYSTRIRYERLTPKIIKDLSKVNFDTENIDASSTAFGKSPNANEGIEKLIGLHTLENGLSYLGITAGGDWEYPIFFMIYSDGQDLRGYIPKEGNTWNSANKSAFGNDEEADVQGLKLRGLISIEDLRFEPGKIEQDIIKRIIYKSCGEVI